jgi:hypothetical protein
MKNDPKKAGGNVVRQRVARQLKEENTYMGVGSCNFIMEKQVSLAMKSLSM